MILELGCGGRLYPDAVGLDKVLQPHTAATVMCDLGFQKLPYDDDSIDLILCRHILEHIPESLRTLYTHISPPKWQVHYPVVHLFNEMYRVLKHAACIYIEIPIYPSVPAFQDPQHVSFWPTEKFNYYSGDYYSFHNVYGHTSRFQKSWLKIDHGWLGRVIFQAVKNVPEDRPYLLDYKDEGVRESFKYWFGKLQINNVF